MKKKKKKVHVAQSASRIKTLQSCTWKYYCNYILKLPDRSNLGAQLGSISHTIFECLGNPRHLKHYKLCKKTKNIYKCEPIRRFVKKEFIKYDIIDIEQAHKVNFMVMQGLNHDFFGTALGKPTHSFSELAFDMNVSEGDKEYRVRGFIDKLFLYKKKQTALIRDFKTSKKVFEGKDATDNLQDQIYSLAVQRLYPEFFKRKVEFPFLQVMEKKGKEACIKMKKLSDADLEACEYILTDVQKTLDDFGEKDAQLNMANVKGFPTDGSFSGKLLCGFDAYEGQLKKDGTKRWGCGYKWPFEFYAIRDKDGKMLRSFFLDEYDKIEYDDENGEEIFIEQYEGCPAWNKIRK